MKGETWKIILTLVLIVAAASWYFWPTVQFFTMDDAQKAALKQADPDEWPNWKSGRSSWGLT